MIKKLFGHSKSRIRKSDKEGKRLLWLTDTYDDHNGISMVLQAMHREIKERDLPIDIMVSSSTLAPDNHLFVIKPLTEFTFSFYQNQPIRIPNYREIRRIFRQYRYDRIICSTEGPMGFAALYLKKMFSVKTFFFLHTDWIMFARSVMKMEQAGLTHIRRLARFYYHRYDGLFVLNTEQQEWLSGKEMRIDHRRVFLTAHWAENYFRAMENRRDELFGVSAGTPVMLFAGRLSHEKGVMELPALFRQVRNMVPGLTLIISGTGPAEASLREAIPEALFLGWVAHDELPMVYSSADILVLPSRFDTFSCVVLEAISCGLPVISYESKGPRDIIQHKVSGYLVNDQAEMAGCAIEFFSDKPVQYSMKIAALKRSESYSKKVILDEFVTNIGLAGAW